MITVLYELLLLAMNAHSAVPVIYTDTIRNVVCHRHPTNA